MTDKPPLSAAYKYALQRFIWVTGQVKVLPVGAEKPKKQPV